MRNSEEPDAEGAAAGIRRFAAQTDLGGRRVSPGLARALFLLALAWSLFQLYVASPLPYWLGKGFVLDEAQARFVHYAVAVFLAFICFPSFSRSGRERVPVLDWILAVLAALSSLYMLVFYESLSLRAAAPITQDMVIAVVGMICLLEAVRRTTGLPLVIVALLFLVYVFAGAHMPEAIAHPGASLGRASDHLWLSSEGVFGFALGVSSSLVFLFVLFGSLLEKAGAGNWFIQSSFALLGHLRGGPAKAAVVSSALTGVISGSALANVVTTGTFTIPLMKRVGFPAEKAAGIESTSSINGQLMPPVMGAAAFLMTEFVGIPYSDVIKHAFLPATISYIALFYIVHLEALKLDLPVIQRARRSTLSRALLGFGLAFAGMVILAGLVYFGIGWLKGLLGKYALPVVALLLVAVYVALLWVSARVPRLTLDDPDAPLVTLPDIRPTLLAGTHFLLPVVVLVWCLMVERYSPSYSVYWAILAMTFLMLTQRPLLAWMRGEGGLGSAALDGAGDLVQGMVAGARNMVGIAIALASAGIIVGAVSLTGLGLVMVNVIELLSGGSLLAMLFFTAIISIVLGMGLPTTANYVVVAAIMAPVVVTLAGQSGVVIPAIAVHLFVFYCGLMSGNTPPVAVDAYAAAALAGSNPMQTCLQAFYYGMRTILLPFIFVYNTELLLIGVDDFGHGALVFTVSVVAMLCFAAGTQGYFLVRSRLHESIGLLLVAFSLLLPGFWLDRVYPPYSAAQPARMEQLAAGAPGGSLLRVWVRGEDFSGNEVERLVALPLGATGGSGRERLWEGAGIRFTTGAGEVEVEELRFGGAAQGAGMDYGWTIQSVEVPNQRPAKQWVYLPALGLLALLVLTQRARGRRALR
jgi:TRAP transporter 4TM/12TM fusion protein